MTRATAKNKINKIMSKKSYATEKSALKAAAKVTNGLQEAHELPSGRWCFMKSVQLFLTVDAIQ